MADLIVLWVIHAISYGVTVKRESIYYIEPVTKDTLYPTYDSNLWVMKGGRWGYQEANFAKAVGQGYFVPRPRHRYDSMVTAQLTPKGFDFVRKRIRELVKDKEIIVADALCGDTLSEDIYKAWEGSANKELLINDSTVKMEWRGTWKT